MIGQPNDKLTDEPDEDFEPRYLDPAEVQLNRSPWGAVRLMLGDRVCYAPVTVRRVRPLTDSDGMISLWIADTEEIGIVPEPDQLDDQSRAIVVQQLERRYFTPVIRKILWMRERYGVQHWQVQTTRGQLDFYVRGLHQHVKQIPPARLLITDVRGNRYDIPDVRQLDLHSFAQIQRHL